MRFGSAILAGVAMLGGCGPSTDNPGNIPKLGRWEKVTKMTSLVANDVWLDREDAPFKLPPDKREVEECMEPKLRTAEELNREIMKGGESSLCSFGDMVREGRKFSSDGTCPAQEKGGGTLSGSVELTGREDEEKLSGKISGSLIFKNRAGASERVRFGLETKWTRLGDCGSKT